VPDALFRQANDPSSSEEIVHFVVTNVDCNPPSTNNALNPSDVHLGLSAGELGCWVDSTVTRVTQTGVEHARIPDASAFLSGWFVSLPGANILNCHVQILQAHWILMGI